MKIFFKYYFLIFIILSFYTKAIGQNEIKIGLIVPLSGENKEIGESIVNTTRMALNSIKDSKIQLFPKDSNSNPDQTLKVSKQLYEEQGIEIIIGPVFNDSIKYLDQLPNITFLSFTNKFTYNYENVINTGVNAVSQINAIKKFLKLNNFNKTLFLIPNNNFKKEIEGAISNTKIKFVKKFIYDTDPTILTSQIEKVTKYNQRKQNLIDEIKRVEKSNDPNKENKLINLSKRDTIGNINFDSIIMSDFDESLKSVTTSLLYTDVSPKRATYITFNQWFDNSLLNEESIQPIYFPSVNKSNYEKYIYEYNLNFETNPNHVSFLSYDLVGLIYYLLLNNDFKVDKNIFSQESRFKGKNGIFKIDNNKITHELNFYSVENKSFKKIF